MNSLKEARSAVDDAELVELLEAGRMRVEKLRRSRAPDEAPPTRLEDMIDDVRSRSSEATKYSCKARPGQFS